jgi:hypothetical protein
MTIGDIDAAPRAPGARQILDYRHPGSDLWCDRVGIVRAKGWWCITTVDRIALSGEIIVGGAAPRARLHSAGFSTRCSSRPHQMREQYQIQRDSWTGWRGYDDLHTTSWTTQQQQANGQVSVLCPHGRVGTYKYRLAVTVDIDSIPVGDSPAASAPIRTDCGTGIS